MAYFFSIAENYTRTPGGRTRDMHSKAGYSGEELLRDHLHPLLKKAIAEDTTLTVNLNGVAGLAASFLEEVFGGLVKGRPYGVPPIPLETVKKHLIIESDDEFDKADIMEDMVDAEEVRVRKSSGNWPSDEDSVC